MTYTHDKPSLQLDECSHVVLGTDCSLLQEKEGVYVHVLCLLYSFILNDVLSLLVMCVYSLSEFLLQLVGCVATCCSEIVASQVLSLFLRKSINKVSKYDYNNNGFII